MKIHHDATLDYLTIDFAEQIEARSVYEDGIIVRYDEAGHVIGIDITDSMRLFRSSDFMTLQEVCDFLGVSESTIRRRIRANKIKHVKEGNRYRFHKSEIIDLLEGDAELGIADCKWSAKKFILPMTSETNRRFVRS